MEFSLDQKKIIAFHISSQKFICYIGFVVLMAIGAGCQKVEPQLTTPKEISVDINRIPAKWHKQYVYLFKFYRERYLKLDSLELSGYQLIDTFFIDDDNGVFKLGANLDLSAPFLVGYEKQTTIKSDFKDLVSGKQTTISSSIENVVYNQLIELQREKVQQLSTYKDPFFNATNVDSLMEIMHTIENMWQSYNSKFDSINQLYPLTFCTEVILPIFKIPIRKEESNFENFSSFLYTNYFNEINLDDADLLNVPYFKDFVLEYLKNYNVGKQWSDVVYGAVHQLQKENIHPEVKVFLEELILGYYIKNGEGEIAKNIYTNITNKCSDEFITTIDELADRYKGLTEGEKFPDIKIQFNNENYSIDKLRGKSSNLLLYFWKSGCHACQTTHLNLKQSYQALKQYDIAVAGISMDGDSLKFSNSIEQLDLPWINISDFKGIKSDLMNTCKIAGTPTLFFINQDNILVKKNASIEQIFQIISENTL